MSQEEGNSNFESQQSMAIPPPAVDETSAIQEKNNKKREHKSHKYLSRNASKRLSLLDPATFPKFASKYASGEKVGEKRYWKRQTRVKRLHKYAIGRGSVGTVIVRTRIKKGLKEIRDRNLPILAHFFRQSVDKKTGHPVTRVMFQAGAIDAALRSGDVFLHDRTADTKQVATDKYGKTHLVTEYDARRAWAIASGDGGRHLANIPFKAREGDRPVHVKREGRVGSRK